MSETTTTTTAKPDETTTTTTQAPEPQQGEVAVDESARSHVLGEDEQTETERLDSARLDGLRNHDAEHENDDPAQARQDGRV